VKKRNPNRGRNSSTSWLWKATRFAILYRDGWRCSYCPAELEVHNATLDHLRPSSRHGTHSPTNLVAACRACNFTRRDTALSPKLYRTLKRQAARPLEREAGRALARFYFAVQSL
jgi:5-methylcytosine-specific restriction endonuclease McrA